MRRVILAALLLAASAADADQARDDAARILACVDPQVPRWERKACPAAIEGLAHGNPDVRLASAIVLEEIAPDFPAPEDVLARALSEHAEDLPLALTLIGAQRAQGAEGAATLASLQRAVELGAPRVARLAASRLAAVRAGPESIEELIDLARWRGHDWTRVAFPLARRLGDDAVAPLGRLARDGSETAWARGSALHLLKELGPSARPALPDVLAVAVASDGDEPASPARAQGRQRDWRNDALVEQAVTTMLAMGPEGRAAVEGSFDASASDLLLSGIARSLASDAPGLEVLARRLPGFGRAQQEEILRALAFKPLDAAAPPQLVRVLVAMIETPRRVEELDPWLGLRGSSCGIGLADLDRSDLAIGLLAQLRDSAGIARLAGEAADPVLAGQAAWALLRMGERDAPAEAHARLKAIRSDAPGVRLARVLTLGSMGRAFDDVSGDEMPARIESEARRVAQAAASHARDADPLVRHAALVLLAQASSDLDGPAPIDDAALASRASDPEATRAVRAVLAWWRAPAGPQREAAEAALRSSWDSLPEAVRFGLPFELQRRMPPPAFLSMQQAEPATGSIVSATPEPLPDPFREATFADLPAIIRALADAESPHHWSASTAARRVTRNDLAWAAWRTQT